MDRRSRVAAYPWSFGVIDIGVHEVTIAIMALGCQVVAVGILFYLGRYRR